MLVVAVYLHILADHVVVAVVNHVAGFDCH